MESLDKLAKHPDVKVRYDLPVMEVKKPDPPKEPSFADAMAELRNEIMDRGEKEYKTIEAAAIKAAREQAAICRREANPQQPGKIQEFLNRYASAAKDWAQDKVEQFRGPSRESGPTR